MSQQERGYPETKTQVKLRAEEPCERSFQRGCSMQQEGVPGGRSEMQEGCLFEEVGRRGARQAAPAVLGRGAVGPWPLST